MGYALNNNNNNTTIVKPQHEPLDSQSSFIEVEDSFLDSLLNLNGWVEQDSSLADVMNPEQNPQMEVNNDLGSLIQEQISKVSLTSTDQVNNINSDNTANDQEVKTVKEDEVNNNINNNNTDNTEVSVDDDAVEVVNDNGANDNIDNCEDDEEDGDNDSEEDESSSSSSSSASSSDDEDEDDESAKEEVEMEEGEIGDAMVAWSDGDEDGGDIVKGPIRSANEAKDLPPVPPVTVTILPHHQTLPVGAVLSIMGSQVVVEGVENHNPLSEGSILWITETRSPLGVVDEIFGPVKNPYYIVRYNSETEIPTRIQQGSLVSFVPEFADYVLNNNNLYKKGYDASGENDEECSDDLEFSDDEKEAEHKRKMKMAKRGLNGEKNAGVKKDKKSRNRGGKWKNDQQSSASRPNNVLNNGQTGGPSNGPTNMPTNGPNIWPTSGPNNGPTTGGPNNGAYAFAQAPNMMPTGVWPFGFPQMQPQNIGFPPSGPPFMQPGFIPQPYPNPQFNTAQGPMFPNNFVQNVPPNFGAFASWNSNMPQNNFNPNQPQAGSPMVYAGLPQGVAMPNGPQMENNNAGVRPFVAGNGENSQNTNKGNGFSNRGGRSGRGFQRGGGRFRGGRGGSRSG
ncbi:uncharacterized protein LOC143602074 isoform X1 [Bidens hawaiensis]|uniref:uncharacterized protein LOC143602074 isoform X1 n=1 Tax=Bidens hawaiensis TaxID=980011 RepID=UPI004049AD9D